ncbi:hypothetical protein [Pseudomonas amygdali]|nr:hypothetical protein [Pseudomonas amygdali]KPC02270.1 Uncharacterized protein AC501_3556 [Pseudomonas amygdali pv. lachrymans]RMM39234.1 hypothetical protein ALQ79_200088 [Pseudomonas amygdali pv. lachrymans]
MRNQHPPFAKHAPHIQAALERAKQVKADGVISGFRLVEEGAQLLPKAGGFTFGRIAFEDETPIQTTRIKSVGADIITTDSGRRYVIADYHGDARAVLKTLRANMRNRNQYP